MLNIFKIAPIYFASQGIHHQSTLYSILQKLGYGSISSVDLNVVGASLVCAVHTQCLSTLCSTHTVPL